MKKLTASLMTGILLNLHVSPSRALPSDPPEIEIAVVGGGLSGLAAARNLQSAHADYGLFEAKDHLGGRTYSVTQPDGTVLNMGGEWIDSDHKAMYALAKASGVTLQKEPYSGDVIVDMGKGPISLAQTQQLLGSIVVKLGPLVTDLRTNRSGLYTDTTCTIPKSLESLLEGLLEPEESLFISMYMEGDSGLSTAGTQASAIFRMHEEFKEFKTLLWARNQRWVPKFAIGWIAYRHRVVGGMSILVNALEKQLEENRVHKDHVLTQVSKDEEGRFHLAFKAGSSTREIVAKSVIMTVPFSVLRHIDLDASLGLSEGCSSAIQNLAYGANAKVHVCFAEGVSQTDYLFSFDGSSKSTTWRTVCGNGATVFLGGEAGKTLSEESASTYTEPAIANLGVPTSAVSSVVVKNWSEDQFARGSYSTLGCNGPSSLEKKSELHPGMWQFAEPVGNFIFAGEHTRWAQDPTDELPSLGYMENAVISGDYAARHYLQGQ